MTAPSPSPRLPRSGRLAVWLVLLLAALPLCGRAADVPVARYEVAAEICATDKTIVGEVTVTLAAGDPRAAGALWFHLPPNRFLAPDPRGERRHLAPLPFAYSSVSQGLRDPWLPDGFSAGSIRIVSVRTLEGVPLPTALIDNPRLPQGYSVRQGLLRVEAPGGAPLTGVVIAFETRLPHRVVDGWSETAWVLEHWFPELARFDAGAWDLDVHRPRPAHFAGRIASATPGWVATGRGTAQWLAAGVALTVPEDAAPQKGLPLAFLPQAQRSDALYGDLPIASLHPPGGARIAELSQRVTRVFLQHVETRFHLPPPRPGILLVQGDLPPGETLTLGHMVVLSRDFSHETSLMDRLFVGTLAAALARVWFGETVWCDEDREAWLPLGFSGYLALDFFEALYGWDARIHTITDWLSPRFREHFYESPVRGLSRAGKDAPLLISLTGYPRAHTALVVLHRKAPLVLRSLAYVVGPEAFAGAVEAFYRDFQGREAGHDDWQATVQQQSGTDLDWFFAEWFHRTEVVDYAIADWHQEPAGNGTRLIVTVSRLGTGRMPVVVQVTMEDGSVVSRRISGVLPQEQVEFALATPPQSVDLDPDELLLEDDRRNNHSSSLYRVRPFFDWSKQREVLVSLQGSLGGNAVDGNYAGLGVNVQLDVDNQVRFIPIYGERTGLIDYEVGWSRSHFLNRHLSLEVSAQRLGGLFNRSVQLSYGHDVPDGFYLSTNVAAGAEQVDAVHLVDDGRVRSQPAGEANHLQISHSATALWSSRWASNWLLSVEHGQPSYGSNFEYTLTGVHLGQSLTFTPWQSVELELIRDGSAGTAPLQKQPLLGGPQALRGYPRDFRLVHEQLAAARLEYHWTLTRAVIGREIQSRRIQLILFSDVGKSWDNRQDVEKAPQRQDVGIGVEFDVNVVGFVLFPARLEIAIPYDDPEYKTLKVILFQALSFF